MNPDGVVALVTGGASGLGRATAEALQARGATVVVLDLQRALEALGDDTGLKRAPADVRDPDGVAAVVALAQSLGPLRILVNCAGIGDAGLVARGGEAMELERFQRVIDINLVGTFNVIRLAAVAMQKNEPVDGERGVIVNTASIAAFDGQMGQTAYAASKGGIVGLTLPLARDLARSLIRCMTIAPGHVRHAAAGGAARGGAGQPGAGRPASGQARRAARVRGARAAHRREPDAERRSDPPRRRAPHGAALIPE